MSLSRSNRDLVNEPHPLSPSGAFLISTGTPRVCVSQNHGRNGHPMIGDDHGEGQLQIRPLALPGRQRRVIVPRLATRVMS